MIWKTIVWKLTENGQYSTVSSYKLQFIGLIHYDMNTIVLEGLCSSQDQNAWIALQNKIWIADRLEKRGWPNRELCPLCNQVAETTDHLFVSCQFTIRIWGLLKEWLRFQGIHPRQ
jgi:hypothetical protein